MLFEAGWTIAFQPKPFARGRRLLLILWLGFPRKDGDRNVGYVVFSCLVQDGDSLQCELDSG